MSCPSFQPPSATNLQPSGRWPYSVDSRTAEGEKHRAGTGGTQRNTTGDGKTTETREEPSGTEGTTFRVTGNGN